MCAPRFRSRSSERTVLGGGECPGRRSRPDLRFGWRRWTKLWFGAPEGAWSGSWGPWCGFFLCHSFGEANDNSERRNQDKTVQEEGSRPRTPRGRRGAGDGAQRLIAPPHHLVPTRMAGWDVGGGRARGRLRLRTKTVNGLDESRLFQFRRRVSEWRRRQG